MDSGRTYPDAAEAARIDRLRAALSDVAAGAKAAGACAVELLLGPISPATARSPAVVPWKAAATKEWRTGLGGNLALGVGFRPGDEQDAFLCGRNPDELPRFVEERMARIQADVLFLFSARRERSVRKRSNGRTRIEEALNDPRIFGTTGLSVLRIPRNGTGPTDDPFGFGWSGERWRLALSLPLTEGSKSAHERIEGALALGNGFADALVERDSRADGKKK